MKLLRYDITGLSGYDITGLYNVNASTIANTWLVVKFRTADALFGQATMQAPHP